MLEFNWKLFLYNSIELWNYAWVASFGFHLIYIWCPFYLSNFPGSCFTYYFFHYFFFFRYRFIFQWYRFQCYFSIIHNSLRHFLFVNFFSSLAYFASTLFINHTLVLSFYIPLSSFTPTLSLTEGVFLVFKAFLYFYFL